MWRLVTAPLVVVVIAFFLALPRGESVQRGGNGGQRRAERGNQHRLSYAASAGGEL